MISIHIHVTYCKSTLSDNFIFHLNIFHFLTLHISFIFFDLHIQFLLYSFSYSCFYSLCAVSLGIVVCQTPHYAPSLPLQVNALFLSGHLSQLFHILIPSQVLCQVIIFLLYSHIRKNEFELNVFAANTLFCGFILLSGMPTMRTRCSHLIQIVVP